MVGQRLGRFQNGLYRPAAFLTMENYLLQQIDGSAWKNKFISLMDRYPEIPATEMGFPEDWRSLALWS